MAYAYVYILASGRNGTLYTGVTTGLPERVYQHRNGLIPGFTSQHNVTRLVYYEGFDDIRLAIQREKQIKKWNRQWKLRLIEKLNPNWTDLSTEFLPD